MRYPTVIVHSEVLSSWLTVSGYTRTQLASELEISKGRVSQLLSSAEEPSARLIGKLITLTGLSFDRLFKLVHNDAQASLTYATRNLKNSKGDHGALARSRE